MEFHRKCCQSGSGDPAQSRAEARVVWDAILQLNAVQVMVSALEKTSENASADDEVMLRAINSGIACVNSCFFNTASIRMGKPTSTSQVTETTKAMTYLMEHAPNLVTLWWAGTVFRASSPAAWISSGRSRNNTVGWCGLLHCSEDYLAENLPVEQNRTKKLREGYSTESALVREFLFVFNLFAGSYSDTIARLVSWSGGRNLHVAPRTRTSRVGSNGRGTAECCS